MMAPQSMSPPCQVSMLVGMGARLHLKLRCCMGLCCPQCWELPSSVVWLEGAFTRSLLWRAGRAQQGCLWHCTEGTTAGRAAALCQQSHGYGCRCLVMYYSGRCLWCKGDSGIHATCTAKQNVQLGVFEEVMKAMLPPLQRQRCQSRYL